MFLHIKIDKTKWCPDNIKYTISFHKTIESTLERSSEFIKTKNQKKVLRNYILYVLVMTITKKKQRYLRFL